MNFICNTFRGNSIRINKHLLCTSIVSNTLHQSAYPIRTNVKYLIYLNASILNRPSNTIQCYFFWFMIQIALWAFEMKFIGDQSLGNRKWYPVKHHSRSKMQQSFINATRATLVCTCHELAMFIDFPRLRHCPLWLYGHPGINGKYIFRVLDTVWYCCFLLCNSPFLLHSRGFIYN